jgi:hypothetical protein
LSCESGSNFDAINHFKLNAYLNNMGYVSHTEAIIQQRKSQVLLLIEIDSEDQKHYSGVLYGF